MHTDRTIAKTQRKHSRADATDANGQMHQINNNANGQLQRRVIRSDNIYTYISIELTN